MRSHIEDKVRQSTSKKGFGVSQQGSGSGASKYCGKGCQRRTEHRRRVQPPPITPEYLGTRPENPRTASKVETGREMPALFLKAYCTRGGSVSKNSINTEGFQYIMVHVAGARMVGFG